MNLFPDPRGTSWDIWSARVMEDYDPSLPRVPEAQWRVFGDHFVNRIPVGRNCADPGGYQNWRDWAVSLIDIYDTTQTEASPP